MMGKLRLTLVGAAVLLAMLIGGATPASAAQSVTLFNCTVTVGYPAKVQATSGPQVRDGSKVVCSVARTVTMQVELRRNISNRPDAVIKKATGGPWLIKKGQFAQTFASGPCQAGTHTYHMRARIKIGTTWSAWADGPNKSLTC